MGRLVTCIREIRRRVLLHWLKLNDDNTEVIRFISKHNNTKFGNDVSCPVSVGSNNINPASRVRNLSVIMDQQLSMIDQVTAVCASCNYHLRRISSSRRYLTPEVTRCTVQALTTSRLDYCNSLLLGLRYYYAKIERLQRIQNKAARLVTRARVADTTLATGAPPNQVKSSDVQRSSSSRQQMRWGIASSSPQSHFVDCVSSCSAISSCWSHHIVPSPHVGLIM